MSIDVRTFDLPPLPEVDGTLGPDLLDADEANARGGTGADTGDWSRAAGRLLRGWSVPPAARRSAREAVADLAEADAARHIAVEAELLNDELMEAVEGAERPEDAWAAIRLRDDLESMLETASAGALGCQSDEVAEILDAVARWLSASLADFDAWIEPRLERLEGLALAGASASVSARLEAMAGTGAEAWWLVLSRRAEARLGSFDFAALEVALFEGNAQDDMVVEVMIGADLLGVGGRPTADHGGEDAALRGIDAAFDLPAAATLQPGIELVAVGVELERPGQVDCAGVVVRVADSAPEITEVCVRRPEGDVSISGLPGVSSWWVDLPLLVTPGAVLEVSVGGRRCRARVRVG